MLQRIIFRIFTFSGRVIDILSWAIMDDDDGVEGERSGMKTGPQTKKLMPYKLCYGDLYLALFPWKCFGSRCASFSSIWTFTLTSILWDRGNLCKLFVFVLLEFWRNCFLYAFMCFWKEMGCHQVIYLFIFVHVLYLRAVFFKLKMRGCLKVIFM